MAGSPHLILTQTKPNCEYKWAKRISVKKRLEESLPSLLTGIVNQLDPRNVYPTIYG